MLLWFAPLQSQTKHSACRDEAQGLDLQLARIEVMPESDDERLTRQHGRRNQRQQVTACRFLRHSRVGEHQPVPGRVFRDEHVADLPDSLEVQRVDWLLVRQWSLE